MIALISGTNRNNSKTELLTNHISNTLTKFKVEHKTVYLNKLDPVFFHADMYAERGEQLLKTLNEVMIPAKGMLFILPEYNGSFPGVLKLFIDALPPDTFHYKKAFMIGHSAGKFGNLRGLEHLTGVLQYLRMDVCYLKPVFSGINGSLSENEGLTNPDYQTQVDKLAEIIKLSEN